MIKMAIWRVNKMPKFHPFIVGVDFDGTIVEHRYPEIGKPVFGAIKALKRLRKAGVHIILWTMRSGRELEEAVAYMERAKIPLYGVNCNPDQSSWTTSPKAYCNIYIDDAAYGCPLIYPEDGRPYVDWTDVAHDILEMVNGR
jgi:hypothetical protein